MARVPAPSNATRPSAELLPTVLAAGAATMAIEILGTRVIAPVFGVNLFVWTALITVTLASLAVGYFIGGLLADRFPTRRLLSQRFRRFLRSPLHSLPVRAPAPHTRPLSTEDVESSRRLSLT